MRFHKQEDGEWVEPTMDGYKVKCCRCGLIHQINFRIVNGRVQFQAFRHREGRSQLQQRRYQAGQWGTRALKNIADALRSHNDPDAFAIWQKHVVRAAVNAAHYAGLAIAERDGLALVQR